MFIVMQQDEQGMIQYAGVVNRDNVNEALKEHLADSRQVCYRGDGVVFETMENIESYNVVMLEATAEDYIMVSNDYPIGIVAKWITTLQDKARVELRRYSRVSL